MFKNKRVISTVIVGENVSVFTCFHCQVSTLCLLTCLNFNLYVTVQSLVMVYVCVGGCVHVCDRSSLTTCGLWKSSDE